MILEIGIGAGLAITNYFVGHYRGYKAGHQMGNLDGYRKGVEDTEKNLFKEYQERARLAYQAGKNTSFAGSAFQEHMKELNPGVPVKVNPTPTKLPPLPPGARGFAIEKDHPWGDEQKLAADKKSGEDNDD